MKARLMTFPEMWIIIATRAIAAFGTGLLLADRISEPRRRRIALPLIIAGVLSTVPLMVHLLRKPTFTIRSIRDPAKENAAA